MGKLDILQKKKKKKWNKDKEIIRIYKRVTEIANIF